MGESMLALINLPTAWLSRPDDVKLSEPNDACMHGLGTMIPRQYVYCCPTSATSNILTSKLWHFVSHAYRLSNVLRVPGDALAAFRIDSIDARNGHAS
eukprot:scaffold81482_cov34-Prasinocladus_malaysianus.AAC.1